jgi:Ca2+-binding RTX toxin-like protein
MVSVKNHIGATKSLDAYFTDAIEVTQSNNHKAIYHDPMLLNSLVVEGTKLKYKDGDFVSGEVDKMTFKDAEGLTIATFKGEIKNFDDIHEFIGSGFGENYMFMGNDKIVGSGYADTLHGGASRDKVSGRGGEDIIMGGRGKDQLTGGSDSDTFYFFEGDGHDVITDFDAIGLDGEQDYLGCPEPLSIKKSGHDTVLTFEGGGTLTLLDVKPSQIDNADFATVL